MKSILTTIIFLSIACFSKAAQFYIPKGDVNALKSAINTSNTNASSDTINLYPYGQYILNTVDNNFVEGDNALPIIMLDGSYSNSLTILGNGAKLILDTAVLNQVRILYVSDCVLNIYDLGFINGSADYDNNPGGAIFENGGTASSQLNLFNCLFKGNSAFQGGALYNTGTNVNIINCTFTQNNALFLGGAITNLSGNIFIQNSVLVNNICTNTSGPGAIYNYTALYSPTYANVNLINSIVALNTYQNSSSPNNGLEFDLVKNSGIYTYGGNFIGSYNNSTTGTPTPFVSGLPSVSNDYVGTSDSVIDPLLGTFARHNDYQESYTLLPGSLALNNNAGNSTNTNPAIASYGLFPTSGTVGDTITIYGKNLSDIFWVQFKGASGITSGFTVTDTSITVVVPADAASGQIEVLNFNSIPATSAQVFTVNAVTGLQPQHTNKAGFTFYPNPATDYLIIKTSGNIYSICDLLGKEVLSSDAEKIDIHNLSAGVYIIKYGEKSYKFIKE